MNKAKIATKPKGRSNGATGKQHSNSNGAGPDAQSVARSNEIDGKPPFPRDVHGPRKELETAIRRYADLYEFAPFGYVTFDRASKIEQTNLLACELLEVKRDFMIGAPFSILVANADLSLFLRHLVSCRAGDRRVNTNLRLKKHSGATFPVLLSSTRTSDFVGGGTHVFQTAIVDLTERERGEQALREKEAELEQIVTQTPFMLTRCTRDLRYRYVSNAYAKMVGCTSEELAGSPIVETMGKKGLAAIQPHIDRVLAGETVTYEALVPFPKQPRFLHAVYVPDKDARGEVVGWIASLIDMSERRRGEEALQRLAAVVQSSGDAIAAKDLNGIVTDWNASAEAIFGYTAKEIIGKSILTVIPRNRHSEETLILNKIRNGQVIDHFETVRQRKDGKLIDVSLTISPIRNDKGKIVGVSKIARDITEHKKIERRLAEQARLLDLSNDAIIVRDNHDRIKYWNHGAKELYGYSAKEALGKVTRKLLRTTHSEPLEQIRRKLDRDNRWVGELIHRRKNGTSITVISRWALDRDPSGRPASILETNTDITKRKQMERELQRSKELLERLVQRRTKALRLANVELETEIKRRKGLEGQILEISDREQQRLGQELHDGICQQLTAIAFMARACALRLKDHRVVEVEELEKIARLINSSVTEARNIAHDLHKEEVDAAGFENALRELAERKIWKTPCRFRVEGDLNVEDDKVASEVFRILREGVINANKHARANEIMLEACRRKRELVFSVTDDGIGMNGDRKNSGGLGFHIMQYRAQSIGARLELESPRRGGTRLAVYLPLTE